MQQVPDALEHFLKHNHFSVASTDGYKWSIYYAVTWVSPTIRVRYSVSTNDPLIEVAPGIPVEWIDITNLKSLEWIDVATLKGFIDGADPSTLKRLSIEESIEYLSNKFQKICEILVVDNAEAIRGFVNKASYDAIENVRKTNGA
jgi:hypothetical protein